MAAATPFIRATNFVHEHRGIAFPMLAMSLILVILIPLPTPVLDFLLVANITNRHPAQLASGINSIQSLAPGRVRFGVGSGAAPGSRFAVEHDMIGKQLGDLDGRRSHLRNRRLTQ